MHRAGGGAGGMAVKDEDVNEDLSERLRDREKKKQWKRDRGDADRWGRKC